MRDEPRDPDQPDNLFEPVDTARDYGAHGPFAQSSHNTSYETLAAEHKTGLAAVALGIVGVIGLVLAAAGLSSLPRLTRNL